MNWRHATSFIHQRRRPGGDATWRHIAFLNLNHRPGASASPTAEQMTTTNRPFQRPLQISTKPAFQSRRGDDDDAGRTGVMRISQPASRFVSR